MYSLHDESILTHYGEITYTIMQVVLVVIGALVSFALLFVATGGGAVSEKDIKSPLAFDLNMDVLNEDEFRCCAGASVTSGVATPTSSVQEETGASSTTDDAPSSGKLQPHNSRFDIDTIQLTFTSGRITTIHAKACHPK